MASGTSLSEYVLSITGVGFPASMSTFRNCRSSVLGFASNAASWLTNGDRKEIACGIFWLLAASRARHRPALGGYGTDELERTGVYRAYKDLADLLRHLDEVGEYASASPPA